jgi:Second Messenger Oligonucleotide or Dinucleotide Synthetase domain
VPPFPLTDHFAAFFKSLNPSPSFVQKAASEHRTVTALLENARGEAAELTPYCFLQGSYKQDTAIYTINDVDIVVLCQLWQPGSGGASSGRSWHRDAIFAALAKPLLADGRYRDKVRYSSNSMCIKVDLGIKLEILPVVYSAGNNDRAKEPFRLYRPDCGQWADGYARYHQQWLTWKNKQTQGNFIPAIKVFKHMRSIFRLDAVSFHLECVLFQLPDRLFFGGPADYIPAIMNHLAATPADAWYASSARTPCGERDVFGPSEWHQDSWRAFHRFLVTGSRSANLASTTAHRHSAIEGWQSLLGKDFFPEEALR